MTLQEIIYQCQARLAESRSTLAAQQAMTWPTHVREAADKIARRTWALCRHAVTDLEANQTEYSIPDRPFELVSVNILSQQGVPRKLAAIDATSLDNRIYGWRTPPNASGAGMYGNTPEFYIEQGRTSYFIFPAPNYSIADGLYVTGYYGVGPWWGLSDEQPFGQGFDEPIIHGAIVERCLEMMAFDDTGRYEKLLANYGPKFEQYLEDRYGEAINGSEANSEMFMPVGPRYSCLGLGAWAYIG